MFETEKKRGRCASDSHIRHCPQFGARLPADNQILKGRTTWRNLHSVFLIQRDFDYLLRFFSVSGASRDKAKLLQVAPGLLSGCRLDCPILFYVSTRFREFQVKAAVLALLDFKHGGADSIKVVKHEGQSVKASS